MNPALVALAAVPALASGAAASPADRVPAQSGIVGAFRQDGSAWFLDEDRWLLEQRAGLRPDRKTRLASSTSRVRKRMGLARWKGLWLLTDGSDRLHRFSEAGAALPTTPLPAPGFVVLHAGNRLWIYNELPSASGGRFWTSADGQKFLRVRADAPGPEPDYRARLLTTLLLLAGGRGGEIFSVPLIGAPVLQKLDARGATDYFSLAYIRSAARAKLTRFDPSQEELSLYSSPAADLVVSSGGQVLVLRNREDTFEAAAPRPHVRRRIDRYDTSGRHLATAEFPSSVSWILREERDGVSVLDERSEVIWRPFGPPVPGAIVP